MVVGDPSLTLAKHQITGGQQTKQLGKTLKKALLTLPKSSTTSSLGGVWNFGPEERLTEIIAVLQALAKTTGISIDSLPLVAISPELRVDENIADCTWLLSFGIPTLVGVAPEFFGSQDIRTHLTETMQKDTNSWILIEPNPKQAAKKLQEVITHRRNTSLE
jgi:carbon-monoxide dehydrogenase catalytic subunit